MHPRLLPTHVPAGRKIYQHVAEPLYRRFWRISDNVSSLFSSILLIVNIFRPSHQHQDLSLNQRTKYVTLRNFGGLLRSICNGQPLRLSVIDNDDSDEERGEGLSSYF